MKRWIVGLAAVAMLCTCQADGAMVQYTDRTSWQTAVGPLSGTEDFSSFVVDTSFRGTAVALSNMTVIGTTAWNGSLTQKIDVLPVEFANYTVDGTNGLLADLTGSLEYTRFDFTSPVSAWGTDTCGISDYTLFRNTVIDVYDPSCTLLGTVTTSSASSYELGFYGFALTSGELADHLIFHNTVDGNNDVFVLDNIGYVTDVIPEPSTFIVWSLLGALGIAAAWWRRRRAA